MSAQIDWDRSGVSLQSSRVNLGPSIGWVDVAGGSLSISAAMALALPFGVALVKVNVAAGAVVLTLPSAKGVLGIPPSLAIVPVTIVDEGGHAQANPITINAAPGETISGVPSISIATNFATVTLRSNPTDGTWSVPQ